MPNPKQRKRERGRFKRYFISEVLWIFCQHFRWQPESISSRGPQLRCHQGQRRRRRWRKGDITGIQFTILAGAFFSLCGHGGNRRSERARRTLAGHSSSTEATCPQRSREEGELEHKSEEGEECRRAFPSSPSKFLLPRRCLLSSRSGLFSLQLQPEQTSTSTSSISLRTSPPPPPRRSFPQTDTATLLDVSFLPACRNKGAQSCET